MGDPSSPLHVIRMWTYCGFREAGKNDTLFFPSILFPTVANIWLAVLHAQQLWFSSMFSSAKMLFLNDTKNTPGSSSYKCKV